MDNEHFADFIQYYRERSEDGSDFKTLWQLNQEYEAADTRLASQSGMPLPDFTLKRDHIGKQKTFDASNARFGLREEYKTKADEIARAHGFKGLSYDEHTRQQEVQKQANQGKQNEAKPPVADREAKRQEFLQQIKKTTERNRSPDKDRDR